MPQLADSKKDLAYDEYRRKLLEKYERNPDDPDPEVQQFKRNLKNLRLSLHSIVVIVRFCDLHSVENKSISGSIKKFNTLSRTEHEKLSERFDLKYLLAIINSHFANFYLDNNRRHRLENYFYPDDFRNLPIADISVHEQKPLIEIVNNILAITKDVNFPKNPVEQERIKSYEKKIDQMVYKLYGFTEEEIKIMDDKK